MLVLLLSLAVLSVNGQNDIHEVESLRKQVEILTETVEKMQVLMKVQGENADHRYEALRKKFDIQTETVENMQVLMKVQGENADHRYEALRKKFDIQTENMEKMQAKGATLELDIQELNRSRLMEPLICFSAAKTSIQEVAAGDNILFDEELIDTHDTYNPTYGIYTVPQDGIYEVIVTLYKGGGSEYNSAFGVLYAGNSFLAMVHNSVDSGTTANLHSTISIIEEFRVGDALHVESVYHRNFYGDSARLSQFSAKYLGPATSA